MGKQSRLKLEKRLLRESKRDRDLYANLEDRVHNEIADAHLLENRGRTLFILSGMAQSTAIFGKMLQEAVQSSQSPTEYFSSNYGLYAVAATTLGYLYLQLQMKWHLQKVKERREVILKTNHAWAYSRNPIYLGMRGMSLSMMAVAPSFLSAAAGAGVFLGTEIAARAEERKLEAYFNDIYRMYKNKVPRWLPRIGYGKSSFS